VTLLLAAGLGENLNPIVGRVSSSGSSVCGLALACAWH